jgi:Domain of unknown function (DUF4112)
LKSRRATHVMRSYRKPVPQRRWRNRSIGANKILSVSKPIKTMTSITPIMVRKVCVQGSMPKDPDPKPRIIDFELLPEAQNPDKENHKQAVPRLIALLMDDLFRLPGTRFRFGLNPILDLIPAVGDGAAALISALTLFVAARYRVPKVIIARMGINIALNALIGLIPGVGEIFAFWFRPSHRNYQLLRTHIPAVASGPIISRRKDWLFVIAIVTALLLLFSFCAGVGVYLVLQLLHAISRT